ncbi:pectate lyase [Reinekea blandensis]|uniref:Periplasmic pectate lyase n=1 Tax=Reinekea blandensis MED297 TaxID=314283 RepID=A4BDJ4_9GAMM|nr:pectate lyase [Reinekea blandensis]EAR09938.1 periplasmic pectate lyase [Reinekea sp. MED297] [Reinekea blandensis MED297]
MKKNFDSILDDLAQYADTILAHYRDPFHGTPLFADGCDRDSGEPIRWRNQSGQDWVVSNLASQQNLFRFFSGLSALTGDQTYEQAAQAAIQWHFDHADSSGLIHWGGHCFIDLQTLSVVGPENKNRVHELKHHCPFYELMYRTDPSATRRLIKAIWNTHVHDWEQMGMTRHGDYGLSFEDATFWQKPKTPGLQPLREMAGLSFVNIGNDLIYSAGMLYCLDGDRDALSWGEFLMQQYVNSRHPETGLGCYQYNQPRKTGEPPQDESDPQYTFSFWGDRAQRQFGPEYGDVAREAWVLFKVDDQALNGPEGIYGDCALAQTQLARLLGDAGQPLLEWTTQGLDAWAHYAYDGATHEIKPIFADGKDLTGQRLPRYGYYGPAGTPLTRRALPDHVFLAYVVNWAVSRSDTLWPVVCQMATNIGLGDWSTEEPAVNLATDNDQSLMLFAALEMYRVTGKDAFLSLAETIGINLHRRSFHDGLFLKSPAHRYCRFDDVEPLALLSLLAAKAGRLHDVPEYRSQGGYIHGDMTLPDGQVKNTMDVKTIYPTLRA